VIGEPARLGEHLVHDIRGRGVASESVLHMFDITGKVLYDKVDSCHSLFRIMRCLVLNIP
jgi:hypothetical protein